MKNITIEIEDNNGNTLMAFVVGRKNNDKLEILKTNKCNIADIDGDYIFNTDNELIRIQAE